MSKKEEFDVDEELKKISRKTNVAAIKSQRSFENQIKKLDVEIDNVINNKLRQFDVDLKLRSDYLSIDLSLIHI